MDDDEVEIGDAPVAGDGVVGADGEIVDDASEGIEIDPEQLAKAKEEIADLIDNIKDYAGKSIEDLLQETDVQYSDILDLVQKFMDYGSVIELTYNANGDLIAYDLKVAYDFADEDDDAPDIRYIRVSKSEEHNQADVELHLFGLIASLLDLDSDAKVDVELFEDEKGIFADITANAVRSSVLSKISSYVCELDSKSVIHMCGQCGCGGSKVLAECPDIIEFVENGKFDFYQDNDGSWRDWYVIESDEGKVVSVCVPEGFTGLAQGRGLVVYNNDGEFLYAMYRRAGTYYAYCYDFYGYDDYRIVEISEKRLAKDGAKIVVSGAEKKISGIAADVQEGVADNDGFSANFHYDGGDMRGSIIVRGEKVIEFDYADGEFDGSIDVEDAVNGQVTYRNDEFNGTLNAGELSANATYKDGEFEGSVNVGDNKVEGSYKNDEFNGSAQMGDANVDANYKEGEYGGSFNYGDANGSVTYKDGEFNGTVNYENHNGTASYKDGVFEGSFEYDDTNKGSVKYQDKKFEMSIESEVVKGTASYDDAQKKGEMNFVIYDDKVVQGSFVDNDGVYTVSAR
jgi:hypothetical protein